MVRPGYAQRGHLGRDQDQSSIGILDFGLCRLFRLIFRTRTAAGRLEHELLRVVVLPLARGDGAGVRQPAVQVDVPAALGTERTRTFAGRLAANRAAFPGFAGGLLAWSGRVKRLSWHSTTRTESENLRRRAK